MHFIQRIYLLTADLPGVADYVGLFSSYFDLYLHLNMKCMLYIYIACVPAVVW